MSDFRFRPLGRSELDVVLDWAAAEGWNPGIHDADAFWAADANGFVGMERDGELIGSGAVVSYDGQAGFMGLFIMRPDCRGRGLGRQLWFHRRDLLRSRLDAGAAISMDGVFAMQSFYAKGGFVFTHRNLRMRGVGVAGSRHGRIEDLASMPFAEVEEFDRRHFGAPRGEFLRKWICPVGGRALGYVEGDGVAGMGVVRRCREGWKIGPLFAGRPAIADALFTALAAQAEGQPVFLDIPENNPDAVALAARHHLTEVFGCARMVFGPVPRTPWGSIYGITTLELG